MEPNRQRRWRQGFTLVETLVVVALVVILLAVSAVGVVYYARWLKITELDNAAREIYLAAENRAVLLSSASRLKTLVTTQGTEVAVTLSSSPDGEETAPGYYIYHSSGSEVADLLPLGTIDPALMDGSFYIVYEPESGSVTDVFYAEDGLDSLVNFYENFQNFYKDISTSTRYRRMKIQPMVGYYGGGTADSTKDDALGIPIVTIHNEETLTVEITYTVYSSMADEAKLSAELKYGDCKITLNLGEPVKEVKDERVRFTYTILLDSLEEGKHFYDLFQFETPSTFGGDFTVTAKLTAEGATPSTDSDTNNSLFAKDSTSDTASIANLRHLQNLDKTSKVGSKTSAVQTNDIDCSTYLEKPYTFTPIQNSTLESYNGAALEIRNLNAQAEGDAGLFASAKGMEFQNIRLVNASVTGTGTGCVGTLVGSAESTDFDNCWVYWEPEAGTASLRSVLGDSEQGYNYQIKGSTAGGLVGQMKGGTLTDCLAATLVNGTTIAGGLIGTAVATKDTEGTENTVDITTSYADCYLSGTTVGGLVGTSDTLTLTDCYAAGFIDEEATSAAGLCTSGDVNGERVYSVMRCLSEKADWKPLAPNITGDNYYLASEAGDFGGSAKTYKEMTDQQFVTDLGDAFARKDQDSHPYNLRTDLALTVYDFPGLKDLPHYGDWNAQFVEASLVYYEHYGESAYGFYGGGVDALQNRQPKIDGYAIAIRHEGTEQQTLTVTYGEKNYSYSTKDAVTVTLNETTFLLVLLDEELVNTSATSEKFYQPLSFTIGDETYGYYYCPHFAKTAVKTDEMPPAPTGVSVRTPRHLYMLSLYSDYYHGNYTFHQELDLDYSTYTGYDLFKGKFSQVPIGRFDDPFNGFYNGGCHVIQNVAFQTLAETTRAYAGLFGYSTGTLRDIVYLMDADTQNTVSLGNHSSLYIGGLAGGNAGSIINCATAGVNLKGNAFTATIYIGGLVGLNQGTISSCAAECAALETDISNYANAYVGGLVGLNQTNGVISCSYAVGRASATADDTSKARVCGFLGYNRGPVQDSYAAMDLVSSGKAVETYGFCGVTDGSQSGTYFLNKGNFTYRDISYNASYTPRKAAPIDYAALTDQETTPVTGMKFVANGTFPYPTAVKDAAGKAVHYGEWPEQMQLGVMGVYYWEKLKIGNAETYHVSLLAADPSKQPKTITKLTTLSTVHSDNGVVIDYGYGYYAQEKMTVTLDASNIYYSTNGGSGSRFDPEKAATFEDANTTLAELMPGYTFHSYHSFGMETDGGGLYPTGSPNGTFALSQGTTTVTFAVNPHFADALCVEKLSTTGWTLAGGASTDAPGSTANNPYEVRAVSQLQNINWNNTKYNTDTVIDGNHGDFPYLSTSNATGKYYWLQTHDLKGESTDAPFSPIAEYYDKTSDSQGKLYGWFGGTYDGDGYVIENVNIQGHTASCAGLFGVVYNGMLRDIILYSSDGEGKIKSTSDTIGSYWYAIGALAGVAASDSNSAVENCAVAGYTIEVNMKLASGKWGGAEIGGLVGISNMNLQNCAAVTTIDIASTAKTGDDNMRVGGLVGASQKAITNCYVGGTIQLGQGIGTQIKGIYIGGIVGGSYFKPLDPQGGTRIGVVGKDTDVALKDQQNTTNNEIHNCYSYVTLPNRSVSTKIGALYALGGTGEIVAAGTGSYNDAANHGICTITNSYYLDSVKPANTNGIKTDINASGVDSLTYAELANEDIYQKLTAYAAVKSEIDGFSVAGKYSYPSESYLQGLNYPFPTILTREDEYHVHYGDWPLNGIKRENGGAPIELDLFTEPEHAEKLELEGVASGGDWIAESADESIADAECNNGTLTVTGKSVGVTTVTVTYTLDKVDYTLSLSVNVTAVLELRTEDSPVQLFTNDTAAIKLTAYDSENEILVLDGLTVTAAVGVYDSEMLETASIRDLTLNLTTKDTAGSTTVNVNYTYTYQEKTYTGMSAINFQIVEPEIKTDEDGTHVIFKDGEITSAKVTSGSLNEDKVTVKTDTVTLDMKDVAPGTSVTLKVVVIVKEREHEVTVTIPTEEETP